MFVDSAQVNAPRLILEKLLVSKDNLSVTKQHNTYKDTDDSPLTFILDIIYTLYSTHI